MTWWLLAWLLAVAAPAAASAPAPVGPAEAATGVTLGAGHLEWLEDASSTMSATDVLSSAGFTPAGPGIPSHGFSRSAFWYRFTLTASPEPLRIEIANPALGDVTVHLVRRGTIVWTKVSGIWRPMSSRDIAYQHPVFSVDAREPATILVRVASDTPVRVPIRVWADAAFSRATMPAALIDGVFYGSMLMVAMFLALLAITRDRSYLAFVCAVVVGCVALLAQDGLGPYYLWPSFSTYTNRVTPVASLFTVLALAVFTCEFLMLGERRPRLRKTILGLALLSALFTVGAARFLAQVTVVTTFAAMLWAGLVSIRDGYAPATRFVAAWAMMLAGVVIGVLAYNGVASRVPFGAEQIYKLVAIPAVAIFSVGLLDRLMVMRREAERVEAALLRQESTLVEVAQGVVGSSGEEVSASLVRHLSRALRADLAFVAELAPAGDAVRTVAAWKDGGPAEPFEYRLPGTPCSDVIAGGRCVYPAGVADQFPRDELLARLRVVGYVGAPLYDTSQRAVGIVACLYRTPVENADEALRTLQIFAARAASELERQRAERALRDQEALLRGVLDSTPAVVYVKDADGRYLLVNREYERLLGKPRDEILGRLDGELYPPDVASKLRENDLKAAGSDVPLEFQERDGDRLMLSRKVALRKGDEAPWAIVGVSTDITDFNRLQL